RLVGKLRGAEAADAVASNSLHAKIKFLVEQGPTGAGTSATTGARVIKRPGSRSSTRGRGVGASSAGSGKRRAIKDRIAGAHCGANDRARINAVAEGADDSEELVVAEAWIDSSLENHVGGFVDSVSGGVEGIIETAACARGVEEEV